MDPNGWLWPGLAEEHIADLRRVADRSRRAAEIRPRRGRHARLHR